MLKVKIISTFFFGDVNSSDALPRLPHFLVVHPAYTNKAKTLIIIITSTTFTLTHITLIHFNGEYTKNKYFPCTKPRK
jgi:hypothetical protein